MKIAQKEMFKSIDGLSLTGELNKPEGPYKGICVLCHPHPLYGGNMHTPLIEAFWKHLPKQGFLTFRFNFRGVGASEGHYEEGVGETQDIMGAVTFLAHQGYENTPFFLIGYSFGAYVIHHLDSFPAYIKGLCLVSPPVSMTPFDFSAAFPLPHLILAGDADLYCNLSTLRSKLKHMDKKPSLTILPGIDHFWSGKEMIPIKKFLSWHETLQQEEFS